MTNYMVGHNGGQLEGGRAATKDDGPEGKTFLLWGGSRGKGIEHTEISMV